VGAEFAFPGVVSGSRFVGVWLLSTGGWAPVVMGWIAGFLRAFRRVCRRLFCGGLCMSFIRRAYIHTMSSVLVHRATVSVGAAICGYVCAARAVRVCCLRFRVVCVVCLRNSEVCVVCVVRFPTLPTIACAWISCPRSALCITACHTHASVLLCQVGWEACVAWHTTHASHALIFFY
jgi:hypothetical protein